MFSPYNSYWYIVAITLTSALRNYYCYYHSGRGLAALALAPLYDNDNNDNNNNNNNNNDNNNYYCTNDNTTTATTNVNNDNNDKYNTTNDNNNNNNNNALAPLLEHCIRIW